MPIPQSREELVALLVEEQQRLRDALGEIVLLKQEVLRLRQKVRRLRVELARKEWKKEGEDEDRRE